MDRDLKHDVYFVTEEGLQSDGRRGSKFAVNEDFQVPLPRVGEIVYRSWVEIDGEEIDQLPRDELSNTEYCSSEKFEVLRVEHNYKDTRIMKREDFYINKLEVKTHVVVRPLGNKGN